jgi:flagellar hook-length control protein FliK
MPKPAEAATIAKPAAPAPPPPAPPEVQFAAANHDKIITGLKSELLPNGGTMHIRLDPPELGALQVKVSMQDGVMTAAFETSNDDATKLLSHSLTQLKHALESQGVSVDKLYVQQSPRNESSSNQKEENGQSNSQAQNQRSAQQEQQRKEMIRRMWAKLGVFQDPLDMVA